MMHIAPEEQNLTHFLAYSRGVSCALCVGGCILRSVAVARWKKGLSLRKKELMRLLNIQLSFTAEESDGAFPFACAVYFLCSNGCCIAPLEIPWGSRGAKPRTSTSLTNGVTYPPARSRHAHMYVRQTEGQGNERRPHAAEAVGRMNQ